MQEDHITCEVTRNGEIIPGIGNSTASRARVVHTQVFLGPGGLGSSSMYNCHRYRQGITQGQSDFQGIMHLDVAE